MHFFITYALYIRKQLSQYVLWYLDVYTDISMCILISRCVYWYLYV